MKQPPEEDRPAPDEPCSQEKIEAPGCAHEAPAQDQDWITVRVEAARADNASVTDIIANRVGELMRGALANHKLTKKELQGVAKEMLADPMPSTPSETAAK